MVRTMLLFLLINFLVTSCQERAEEPEQVPRKKRTMQDVIDSMEKTFRNAYHIESLKDDSSTGTFRFQVFYKPEHNFFSLFEGEQRPGGNWILCVKQDFEFFSFGGTPQHDLGYQQICTGIQQETGKLDSLLKLYNTGKKITDECRGCWHHDQVEIEILDHGEYSFYKADHPRGNDSLLTFTLMGIFGLNEENAYSIYKSFFKEE